jgi:Polypeptide deformylase
MSNRHQPFFQSDRDDGVGLAAPQVGINIRLMVFNPEGERGQGEELVLANPRIISASRKQELSEEGCLSFLKFNSSELILADVEARHDYGPAMALLLNRVHGVHTADALRVV